MPGPFFYLSVKALAGAPARQSATTWAFSRVDERSALNGDVRSRDVFGCCGDDVWNHDGWSGDLLLPESMRLSSGTNRLQETGLQGSASRAFLPDRISLAEELKHMMTREALEK